MDRYAAPDLAHDEISRETLAQDEFGIVPDLDRRDDAPGTTRDETKDRGREATREAARSQPGAEGDRRQADEGRQGDTRGGGARQGRAKDERTRDDRTRDDRKGRTEAPTRERDQTAARPRRRALWLGVLVVALLAAGYGGWRLWQGHAQHGQAADGQQGSGQGSGQGQSGAGAKGVPVTVTQAKAQDVPVYLYGLGTVEAENTVTVRTQVDGQVVKVAYQEGQDVHQGDLLVQIDPRPFQATLDQATAKLAADQASLKDANTNLQRYSQLAQQQFASRQQLDTQYATVSTLQANLKGDQAAIDAARTQLGFATIRAPITGRTGFRLVDEGNVVHSADTSGLVVIQQLKPIAVVFTAPEDQVQQIRDAKRAGTVKAWALSSDGSRTLDEGTLEIINNQVDATSGTIQLKAVFPNAHDQLWPGLSVSTRLEVSTIKDGLTVPDDAIQHGQDGLFVYAVGQDGKAAMAPVEVSHSDNGLAVVAKGLKAGQSVVVEGQYKVQPGVKLDAKPLKGQGGQGQDGQQIAGSDPQAGGASAGKAQPGDGGAGGRDASHQTSPVTVRQE